MESIIKEISGEINIESKVDGGTVVTIKFIKELIKEEDKNRVVEANMDEEFNFCYFTAFASLGVAGLR